MLLMIAVETPGMNCILRPDL
ncbi:hypothetical protein BRAS3843_520098 [Bradyrhizobium sp. STM 3843]|nr:hypothetical protein BRAS3843_520098 [Bradyrhizobium sp. STM 3843]